MKNFGSTVLALGFSSYEEYLLSSLWLEKRQFLLESQPVCDVCKERRSQVVHHLRYDSVGNEQSGDVVCLCQFCHAWLHNERREA
jgi:hypothetical protein